jgi:hypothetical protein
MERILFLKINNSKKEKEKRGQLSPAKKSLKAMNIIILAFSPQKVRLFSDYQQ